MLLPAAPLDPTEDCPAAARVGPPSVPAQAVKIASRGTANKCEGLRAAPSLFTKVEKGM
jgi:hypothetical protein